jgi:hypothetical protein
MVFPITLLAYAGCVFSITQFKSRIVLAHSACLVGVYLQGGSGGALEYL